MLSSSAAAVVDKFVGMCRSDGRVLAAFLSGSHATGTADAYSDIDLGLITADSAYDSFAAQRTQFVEQLGEPLFLENFDNPHTIFFILADGTEGELTVARESRFTDVVAGAYRVLIDKANVLADATFIGQQVQPDDQREMVRRLIVWFWHEFSHLQTALARGQLLWAYGQLEALRRTCVSLARLAHNADDIYAAADPYFKVEVALTSSQLEELSHLVGKLDPEATLSATNRLVEVYRDLAKALAPVYGLTYPAALERIMLERSSRLVPAQTPRLLRL